MPLSLLRRLLFRSGLLALWRAQSMALAAVWAYKARGAFIVVAIALGVSTLTVIIASVDGARRKALQVLDSFGPDAVLVAGGDIENRPVGQRVLTLSEEDAQAIQDSLPGVREVAPLRMLRDIPLKAGSQLMKAQARGGGAGFAQSWSWPLVEGRDLTAEDVSAGAKVALLGDGAARELFGDESVVGKSLLVDRTRVEVVGRLAPRGAAGDEGGKADDLIALPMSTLTQRFNLDRKMFMAMRVKFDDPERMVEHVERLRAYLRELHGLGPDEPDDFSIRSPAEILKLLTFFTGGVVVFLGVTAALAMVAGGFVLANLFLLNVSERSQEIGLKRALGATPRAIAAQFLSEAAWLTSLGGLAGAGLGSLIAAGLANLGVLEVELSAKAFAVAIAATSVIALVFGLQPARKAAALDPIAALQDEG